MRRAKGSPVIRAPIRLLDKNVATSFVALPHRQQRLGHQLASEGCGLVCEFVDLAV